ncbi:hypothetical protein POSPLADRAFT_1040839 [Postia placenta MAD-698-R-SB12]|uniref:Uncharacterized protein n=1 Tax=Postia placenta MAD-698-R-SB12 TaxID=670580 RepID=A0A1X6MUQ2_9APHY|nr:hypothetical protein POSPLADRAFT_1040839 [Postia placenta MAD-698-R-SB12]OSX59952.1 hypothetical protein POSPLADRAFT_1040839 [Postia placenta MAD-698-R-SB12]
MNNAITKVASDLGIKFPSLRIAGFMQDDDDTIVSLFTNHDIKQGLPSPEDGELLALYSE